ncbi:MAG: hypothetical protein JO325_14355, partial [Solirubrobacterales bacterium]|nr:hypothetical protein [Solirubrobacterales bacterium]
AFNPDGRILAAADLRGTVMLWNLQTRRPVGAPLQTHHLVNSVAYSLDGETLAAGNGDNGTVGLWAAQSHHLIRTVRTGTGGPVNSVVFDPRERIWPPVAKLGRSSYGACRATSSSRRSTAAPALCLALPSAPTGARLPPEGSTGR